MKGGLYRLSNGVKSSSYCWKQKKPCVWWVQKYFADCLCNLRDELSFACGFVSLVAWGVAEVPQIITNFRTKSSHGVSLCFLLTWFLGFTVSNRSFTKKLLRDIFNLTGCLLEPATLPTQFYTALLYTTSTIVLVLQSLYYDHFYTWWKCRHNRPHQQDEEEKKKPLNPNPTIPSEIPIPGTPVRASPRREFYYMSARSLAGSDTPPFRSYLRVGPRSGPSTTLSHHNDGHSSSEEDEGTTTPIPIPGRGRKASSTQPRQIPRHAARGAMLAASVNLPIQGTNALMGFTGRRMLNERSFEHNAFGQWLGWLMAAIYMGSRIPQIILNIKRGSVEGLNPWMFVFALVANITYVGSIVIRTTEWESIRANMPWLLDAVACVVLDLFIIMQYVYYKYLRNDSRDEEQDYYYEEPGKTMVS